MNNANQTNILKTLLLTLFIDIIGFSIMFPILPHISIYYTSTDPDNFLLKTILSLTSLITSSQNNDQILPAIVFGGIISGIYSFLQFIFIGFWGRLSDKIGRKKVLLLSVGGITFSYFLWIFSRSFTLFFLSRTICAIMGGKITTGTAIIADITDHKTRTKGMALTGTILGLGYILGPAIGGFLAALDLSNIFPVLNSFGINPFSLPALAAFILSFYNLIQINKNFSETLLSNADTKNQKRIKINPLQTLQPFPFKGVNKIIYSFFIFLIAYSGMEFSLTFFAKKVLNYSTIETSFMFIFAGLLISLIQGTFVKKHAHRIGEKKIAIIGISTLIPAFLLLSQVNTSLALYISLFFISIGTALTLPSLSSLLSFFTPKTHQGEVTGVFRSFGALARVFGPMTACFIFWQYNPHLLYILGSIVLLIPIFIISSAKPVFIKEDN